MRKRRFYHRGSLLIVHSRNIERASLGQDDLSCAIHGHSSRQSNLSPNRNLQLIAGRNLIIGANRCVLNGSKCGRHTFKKRSSEISAASSRLIWPRNFEILSVVLLGLEAGWGPIVLSESQPHQASSNARCRGCRRRYPRSDWRKDCSRVLRRLERNPHSNRHTRPVCKRASRRLVTVAIRVGKDSCSGPVELWLTMRYSTKAATVAHDAGNSRRDPLPTFWAATAAHAMLQGGILGPFYNAFTSCSKHPRN